MNKRIGTQSISPTDTKILHPDTVSQNLKFIRNTHGVLEAWLGGNNTYCITLENLRVICLRDFQLPTIQEHILMTQENTTSLSSSGNEEKTTHGIHDRYLQQGSTPLSLNIKNLNARTRRKQIEEKSNNNQNKNLKVRNIQDMNERRVNGDELVKEDRLQKFTEIAAKYLKTMGVVQEIEPLEILSRVMSGKGCSYSDLEAFFESKNVQRLSKPVESHSFLPENDNFSRHTEERSLAGSTKTDNTLDKTTVNRRQDKLNISSTAHTLNKYEKNHSTRSNQNCTRIRYIRKPRKGIDSRVRIVGSDTLGALPDESESNIRHNITAPRRSSSMPDNFMVEQKLAFISNHSKQNTQPTLEKHRSSSLETFSEPTSSLLGVTFIVGNGGDSSSMSVDNGGESGSLSLSKKLSREHLSSDFLNSGESFFSSRECSQEKVSWLKDSACSRLARMGKKESDQCSGFTTYSERNSSVLMTKSGDRADLSSMASAEVVKS